MENFVVGTLVHSQISADPRDLKAEEVLPMPTDEELKNLQSSFDQGIYIGATYYQNGWGSCTAMGTTHSMLIQNTKEVQRDYPALLPKLVELIKAGTNAIFLDWKDLWAKMGHDLNNKDDSGDYVEKAMNTAISKGIAGKDIDGKDFTFFGKNYSYKTAGVTDLDIAYVKYYITKYPIIDVFLGDNNTWNEMSRGEVKTIIQGANSTGGHCICRSGYDAYGPIRTNSWTPNDPTKKKCIFRMSWDNYKKGIQSGMINWRYWQLFDKEDAVVDLDALKQKKLQIKANQAVLSTISATYIDTPEYLKGSLSALADAERKELGIEKSDLPQEKKVANMVADVLSYARKYVPAKYQTQFSKMATDIRTELI